MAHAIGSDMQAVGVHQGLSPLLDVVRDYRWGRVEETIGEDPYVVGTLGTAYVQGLQNGGVIATLKHFAGYSASRAGHNHAPVSMGPREFEDMILAPFEMAVRDGQAGSVMNSYSDLDGLPAVASHELLTGVLRDRWGFEGTVVSDYWSVTFLETMHRVAADRRDAGVKSLAAGLDVELPNTDGFNDLAAAVRDGVLDEEVVDRAARRVLQQKVELGLLDASWQAEAQGVSVDLDSPRNRDIARRVAEASITLLKNDHILPLSGTPSLAVLGPCGEEARTFMGCYSYPNHVMHRYPDLPLLPAASNLADALEAELGRSVLREQGVPILTSDAAGLPAAVAAAQAADVAVVAVGDLAGLFGQGTSGEGCDALDLTLPGLQAELVEAVLGTGTPTVLVVISGRPYSLGAFVDRCAAVVQAFMPGEEGGGAIARTLTGTVNPSGKLPIAIPDHAGGQPGTYLVPPLGWFTQGISNLDPRPLYPFGHGLSYTSFELSDLQLSASEVTTDASFTVTATLTNTGQREGAEVVQLYVSDPLAEVTRPLKTLTGYVKVLLAAGAAATVTFDVHTDRTSFIGADLTRVVEPGELIISVGNSSENRPLRASMNLRGPRRVVPEGRILTTPVQVALKPDRATPHPARP